MPSVFLFLYLSLLASISYAGFAPETAVLCDQGFIPIGQLQKDSCVISYDLAKKTVVQGVVNNHNPYMAPLAYTVVCNNDTSFIASPTQLVLINSRWCFVRDLKSGDRLQCWDLSRRSGSTETDGSSVTVLAVEVRSDEQLLCEITVEPYHTFCVTSRGIIVHNSPAIVISAAPAVIPVVAKAAGIVATVGAALYSLFANPTTHKASSDRAGHNIGRNSVNNFSTCSTPPPPEDPRNKNKYENMEQVFERAPMGRRLQSSVEPTKFSYKTSKIYRVIRDIKEFGIKKGDWLYLDKMHGDHIEVFKKCGKVMRAVLNMDGTQNLRKAAQAGIRSIEKYIR